MPYPFLYEIIKDWWIKTWHNNHRLMYSITYTSIVAILFSVALFIVSNYNNQATAELILQNEFNDRFYQANTDVFFSTDPTLINEPAKNTMLTNAWWDFLVATKWPKEISNNDINKVKTLDDYDKNIPSDILQQLATKSNIYQRKELISDRLGNLFFASLAIAQVFNILFAIRLMFLDHNVTKK